MLSNTLFSPPAPPSPTHQTGKWAMPPGRGHIFSEEKQPANLITVAGREEKRLLLK